MNVDLTQLHGRRVCVALSGGRDSVCLLHVLRACAGKEGITLSALTCEHGIRGEESLALLRKAAPHAGIILVSKDPANAMLGYAVEASGFLSLPLGDEALSQAFARAYRRAQEEDDGSILIKEKSGYRRVYARDVRFVQVSGHRLIFHLFDGTITTRGQLCGAEERLEKAGFFRCSANYMVNLRYVEWPNRGRVRVGSSETPVSRQKKGDLYGRLCGRARRKVPHCGEVYIL